MTTLIQFFIGLALLKRKPQELPTAPALLAVLLALNVLVGVTGNRGYFGSVARALAAQLVDVLVVAGMLWLLLSVYRQQARLLQTASAVFGLGTLFGLLMLFAQSLLRPDSDNQLVGMLLLGLLLWAHVAVGHVLRHALEQRLGMGIALAVGISVVSFVVVMNLFPAAV